MPKTKPLAHKPGTGERGATSAGRAPGPDLPRVPPGLGRREQRKRGPLGPRALERVGKRVDLRAHRVPPADRQRSTRAPPGWRCGARSQTSGDISGECWRIRSGLVHALGQAAGARPRGDQLARDPLPQRVLVRVAGASASDVIRSPSAGRRRAPAPQHVPFGERGDRVSDRGGADRPEGRVGGLEAGPAGPVDPRAACAFCCAARVARPVFCPNGGHLASATAVGRGHGGVRRFGLFSAETTAVGTIQPLQAARRSSAAPGCRAASSGGNSVVRWS